MTIDTSYHDLAAMHRMPLAPRRVSKRNVLDWALCRGIIRISSMLCRPYAGRQMCARRRATKTAHAFAEGKHRIRGLTPAGHTISSGALAFYVLIGGDALASAALRQTRIGSFRRYLASCWCGSIEILIYHLFGMSVIGLFGNGPAKQTLKALAWLHPLRLKKTDSKRFPDGARLQKCYC